MLRRRTNPPKLLDLASDGDSTVELGLPLKYSDLEVGDALQLGENPTIWLIERLDTGDHIRVLARKSLKRLPALQQPSLPLVSLGQNTQADLGPPSPIFLDLPMNGDGAPEDQFRVAVAGNGGPTLYALASRTNQNHEVRSILNATATVGTLETDLPPGHFSGRVANRDALLVRLISGEFESVDAGSFANGSNLAAVQSSNGGWEVLQFQNAEEQSENLWAITGLLRGQGGTETAMSLGATAGTQFVLLDAAVVPAGLNFSERQTQLNWRVGQRNKPVDDEWYSNDTVLGGMRALVPLAPVHLKGSVSNGGIELTWLRRGRVDADNWLSNDILLGEDSEAYSIKVARNGATIFEQLLSTNSAFLAQTAPGQLDVEIRQLSAVVGLGDPLVRSINVQ